MPTPKPSGLVNVKVFVDGNELPGDFQVAKIFVRKEINRIASATVHFLDGNPTLQKFEVSDKSDLEPGAELEIKVGYDTDADPIFKGMITKHSVKIKSGSSYTVVECKDKAVLLTVENHSEIFEEKKDSDIIKTLIQGHSGVSADVQGTDYEHPQIIQYDCTDWDFVVSRAELNGKIVNTIDNKVIVKEPKIEGAKLTLEYGTNILEFEADVNSTSQLSKVVATSWDIKSQKVTTKEVTSASFTENGSLKASDLAIKVKKDGHNVFHSGAVDANELKAWGTSLMLKSMMAKLIGTVKCKGYADINPADTLELKGVGKKFNGDVFVSSVKHEIHGGYWFTSIRFGLSDELHSRKYKTSAQEASGLIPAVHGLQIGIVKNIHEDPDNQNRIQVSLPVFGSKTNVWARQAFADAGKDRGVYFVPEVNDEVIVGFLNDDGRFPVILGGLHSSKNKTPYTTDEKNIEKGITTREKLKITFNDDKKIITIETPGKQSIVIDDDAGEIVITDKSKNSITMKSNLIEMKGAGDIKVEAKKNIEIKCLKFTVDAKTDAEIKATNIKNTAKAQFVAKGNAKAELNGGGQAVVKGGGMVQIQGALVKIN